MMQAGSAPAGRPGGLIRVSGLKFVDDACREFLLAGWNT
jgi:hypothetical protein